jgi:hypothetical protein
MSITKSVAKLADSDNNPLIGEAQAHIADLAAITGGDAPTEAEHNAVRTAINSILLVLEAHGLVKTS